jgi:prepilin-type N-terminal cleavage/methylation domain-containing protein
MAVISNRYTYTKLRVITDRHGFTLTEVLIAMTIICILIVLSTPIYSRAMEQARLDAAASNLKMIWSAQRVYWLDEHSYAPDLAALYNMDLLSSKLVLTKTSLTASYAYEIEAVDNDSFTAIATRKGSNKWSGQIRIDEFGDLTGGITASDGLELVPVSTE